MPSGPRVRQQLCGGLKLVELGSEVHPDPITDPTVVGHSLEQDNFRLTSM